MRQLEAISERPFIKSNHHLTLEQAREVLVFLPLTGLNEIEELSMLDEKQPELVRVEGAHPMGIAPSFADKLRKTGVIAPVVVEQPAERKLTFPQMSYEWLRERMRSLLRGNKKNRTAEELVATSVQDKPAFHSYAPDEEYNSYIAPGSSYDLPRQEMNEAVAKGEYRQAVELAKAITRSLYEKSHLLNQEQGIAWRARQVIEHHGQPDEWEAFYRQLQQNDQEGLLTDLYEAKPEVNLTEKEVQQLMKADESEARTFAWKKKIKFEDLQQMMYTILKARGITVKPPIQQ